MKCSVIKRIRRNNQITSVVIEKGLTIQAAYEVCKRLQENYAHVQSISFMMKMEANND
jgi:outer membrane lipoprotein-sorting protein